MTVRVKVCDEQVTSIGQLGDEFAMEAERRLGEPKGEGEGEEEGDGEGGARVPIAAWFAQLTANHYRVGGMSSQQCCRARF
ncbi:MAG: hypothetical protein SLRJCFUN_001182 [Candidatus Fervidibacter sp.]